MPLDAPCRCARTLAGGAIGREALDAGTAASGAGIKTERGEARASSAIMTADIAKASIAKASFEGR